MKRLALGVALFAVTLVLAYQLGPTIYHLSNDRAALEAFLDAAGIWAPLGFILLVASQVILAPIPSFLTGIAGGFIFGILPGFLLNLAGMLLGAMVAFSMVRIGGKPLVDRFLGPRYGHWLARINGRRGALVIGAIFLVPFLPDDAICWLAALTPIRARLFAALVVVGRTPAILVASLTGAGVIDLPWYGWAVVAVLSLIGAGLAWWKKDLIEQWCGRWLDVLGAN